MLRYYSVMQQTRGCRVGHLFRTGMEESMRKVLGLVGATLLFAGPALAADLAVKAPVRAAPVVAPFSWAGLYIGAHIGAGWGTKEWDEFIGPFEFDSSHTVNGILGGGQIGYNFQPGNGPWVWGAEVQFSGADLKGKGNCGVNAVFNCGTKVDAIGTFAGRFGFLTLNNQALVYLKGGGAFAHDKFNLNEAGIVSSSISDDRWGWMLGTGVEYAITNNWSAKVEYNYMDLGTKSYQFSNFGGFGNFDITQRLHLVKFGVNYHLW
jgi:outer membrane immunogenic protein